MSTDVVDDLVVVFRGAVPADITANAYGQDIAYAVAEILAMAEEEVARLSQGALLATATGAFLDLHAKDRGLRRQGGETDDQLRARLQTPPQAGTRPAIVAALETIVGVGNVQLIELPRASAYCDTSMCFDSGNRVGGGRGIVVALIPTTVVALNSVTDALRSKVSAGKLWFVEEY